MCKAWDGAMQMYAEEASERTRKEVTKEVTKQVTEEVTNQLTKQHARKMYKKGISIEDIAGILERPTASVREWCENSMQHSTSV